MKSLDIKGKPYVLVNERLKYFREHYPEYSLTSEIISLENGICVIKAVIKDTNNNILATGHAYEKENSTFINKTSFIENCETSAWGRALGNFGIGIDTSIASAEEVINAVLNQEKTEYRQTTTNPRIVLYKKLKEAKLPDEQMNAFCTNYGIDSQNDSSIQNFLRKGNIENYVNEYMGVVNAG